MRRSVRLRLTFWNVGVLAVVLLIFLIAMHLAVRFYMFKSIDSQLRNQANGFAQRFARPDNDAPERPLRLRGYRNNYRWMRLFDTQGRSMTPWRLPATVQESPWDMGAFRAGLDGRSRFSTIDTTIESEAMSLRVYSVPLERDGQRVGVMQIALSLTEVYRLQRGLTLIVLLLAPLALLAAGFGGLFLTDRMLFPVREITRAADDLNAEDLSRRLPVTGDDEFAHLATTINRMLIRLQGAFTRLETMVEQERRFTSDASHELRTPLTAIKANTSLALRGERTPEQYRTALIAADRAADMMNRMVQDLLLLARSDGGQLTIAPQSIAPGELLREVIKLAGEKEGQAQVRVAEIDPALRLWGDPHHLTRLLLNLLENALRHTPATGEITLGARAAGTATVLTVIDTGEGIPAEHLPHIIERFYRVDTARARQHGGTGLGLAICQSIVDAHQGQMTLSSVEGQGTTVTVTVPGKDEK